MTEKLEGIILRVVRFKESDRFIHVLTPAGEVAELLARSVGKSVKRFGGGLEPLSWQRFEVSKRRSTLVAEQAQHVDDFLELRRDLASFYLACYAAERALLVAPCEGLFDTTIGLLRFLPAGKEKLPAARAAFDLKVLSLAGLAPRLTECAHCGEELGSQAAALDGEGGGFLCARHADAGAAGFPAGIRSLLQALTVTAFDQLARVRMSPAQQAGVRRCVEHFTRTHLPGLMRSQQLLERELGE